MNESTKKLVAALEEKNEPRLKKLIKRAKREEFHDYDSDHTFPSIALYGELMAYGFPDLAQRAMEGEFDATKEESEKWAQTLEGMESFDDPEVVAGAKELAMFLSNQLGEEWDEEAWNEHIKKNRLRE